MTEDLHHYLDRIIQDLERQFDLRAGFFRGLLKEDDWSFTIKLHALVEAAVTHLLTSEYGDDRLNRVFEKLPLSDADVGKLAFVDGSALLDRPRLRFIRRLSELRNHLVHKVGNVHFSFTDYVGTFDANQRKAWAGILSEWAVDGPPREGWRKEALVHPKETIWATALGVILTIQARVGTSEAERTRLTELARIGQTIVDERDNAE